MILFSDSHSPKDLTACRPGLTSSRSLRIQLVYTYLQFALVLQEVFIRPMISESLIRFQG